MNNACLIAAGAAASRRASKSPLKYNKKEGFVLKVQKRYYFEPRRYLTEQQESVSFTDVPDAPLSTIEYAKVPAKTFMAIRDFPIPASIALCSDFNTYVEDNFELFTSIDVWQFYDKQIIDEYVNWVYDYCNIEIDSAVNYSVKYYWNVDIVRED
jgi:hypothetical protein